MTVGYLPATVLLATIFFATMTYGPGLWHAFWQPALCIAAGPLR